MVNLINPTTIQNRELGTHDVKHFLHLVIYLNIGSIGFTFDTNDTNTSLLNFVYKCISFSVDTPDIVTPLELDLDFIEILSKTVNPEKEGTDVLKRKIHNSEFHEKYASYCLKPNLKHMSITGNWRKDLGIQTAADFFNIKIYVVVQMESGETKTYCFFPKDFDTEDWIKIAFGKEKEYMLLSGRWLKNF